MEKFRSAGMWAGKLAPLVFIVYLYACAETTPQVSYDQQALAAADAQIMEDRMSWSTECDTDAVTAITTCKATTSGRRFDGKKPYGLANLPFEVYFIGHDGPYFNVGINTYPGETPIVRVDDHDSTYVYNGKANAPLVKEMLNGHSIRARYYVWPDGGRDMYVSLNGFREAWQKLKSLTNK